MRRVRSDWAHEKADETLIEIGGLLDAHYTITQNKANKELKNYLKQFDDEREKKRQELAPAAFSLWATGKILSGKKWSKTRDKIVDIYVKGNQKAAGIINGFTDGVFKQNYDFMSFMIGEKSGNKSKFNPFNLQKLKDLWKERELWRKANIYVPKDQRWHKQKIKSIIKKGIKNGESIDQIVERLKKVGLSDEAAARRTARTAVTGAENAGRLQVGIDVAKKGIVVDKIWYSLHDARVRPSHASIDGERVPINEEFSNGLMYPGDPNGDPSEFMNCRCRMDTAVNDESNYNFDEDDFYKWLG